MILNLLFSKIQAVTLALVAIGLIVAWLPCESHAQSSRLKKNFHDPVRLEADGEPIVIGRNQLAHAGPCVADVDCDGVDDLLVGAFSGNFWYFKNTGSQQAPVYTAKGKLRAGGEDAIVPIY